MRCRMFTINFSLALFPNVCTLPNKIAAIVCSYRLTFGRAKRATIWYLLLPQRWWLLARRINHNLRLMRRHRHRCRHLWNRKAFPFFVEVCANGRKKTTTSIDRAAQHKYSPFTRFQVSMRMSSLKWSSSWPKRIESNGIESENKAKSNISRCTWIGKLLPQNLKCYLLTCTVSFSTSSFSLFR